MGEVENKLLNLTSSVPAVSYDAEVVEEVKSSFVALNEIDDLIGKGGKNLTNLDYQILVAMSGINGEENVAEEYGVTKGYIRKLLRSPEGSDFMKEQAKQKAEMSLAVSTNIVAEGLTLYKSHIEGLLQKGQVENALMCIFGRQSLSEVQGQLHKQQASIPAEDNNGLMQLFTSITIGGK